MINGLKTRLTKLRQDSHLTQVEAGRLIGVSSSLVSAYETGNRVPPLETIVKYAATFHVTTDYLLGCEAESPLNLDGLSVQDREAIETIISSLKSKGHH